MKITVTINEFNLSFPLEVFEDDTFGSLKEKIYQLEGIQPSEQNLIFGGNSKWEDSKKVTEGKMKDGSVVKLVLPLLRIQFISNTIKNPKKSPIDWIRNKGSAFVSNIGSKPTFPLASLVNQYPTIATIIFSFFTSWKQRSRISRVCKSFHSLIFSPVLLQSLNLGCVRRNVPDDFLQKWGANITQLNIQGYRYPIKQLATYFPNLEELYCQNTLMSPQILQKWIQYSPKLRVLELSITVDSMETSDWEKLPCLTHLQVAVSRNLGLHCRSLEELNIRTLKSIEGPYSVDIDLPQLKKIIYDPGFENELTIAKQCADRYPNIILESRTRELYLCLGDFQATPRVALVDTQMTEEAVKKVVQDRYGFPAELQQFLIGHQLGPRTWMTCYDER